jgi:hypothetical protein
MQNVAKRQNATLAMAFLLASLIITPLSLKAFGVSLNLSAGVEAWRRIAGTIADNYQPLNAAELIALSFSTDESESDQATPAASPLMASTQPLDMQLTAEPGLRISDQAEGNEPVASPAPVCPRSVKRAARVNPPSSKAPIAIAPVARVKAQTLAATEVAKTLVIREEALQEVKQAMSTYRFNIEKLEKLLPKEFKVMVKAKPTTMPSLPAMTGCAQRKPLSPEQVKQVRAAAWSLTLNSVADSPEKSEL